MKRPRPLSAEALRDLGVMIDAKRKPNVLQQRQRYRRVLAELRRRAEEKLMTILHVPPNTMPRIERIWAYLSVDKNGNEGVCAAPIGGMTLPLIAADQARLESLTPIAERLAEMTGMTIRLVELTQRIELREIKGRSS